MIERVMIGNLTGQFFQPFGGYILSKMINILRKLILHLMPLSAKNSLKIAMAQWP